MAEEKKVEKKRKKERERGKKRKRKKEERRENEEERKNGNWVKEMYCMAEGGGGLVRCNENVETMKWE